MTDRRIRDLRRLLEGVAETFDATVSIEPTRGGHLRGVFTVGERQAFIIASFSPNDPHVSQHIKADARRTLRKLAGAS